MSNTREPAAELARLAARWSTAWLVAANAAGLLLATLLLVPALGEALGPLSYGRWVPVHFNAQLYGWCALPLVGVLLRAFLAPVRPAAAHARLAFAAWSAALLFGCASWLAGGQGGKLFVEWSGPARVAFPLALCVLWSVLAHHAFQRMALARTAPGGAPRWPAPALRFALLAALLVVPGVMYFAADPRAFPPVNPHSGGATGTSLYLSTLALVVIFAAVPWLVDRPAAPGQRRSPATWWVLAAGAGAAAFLDHGHASHHGRGQIAALALLFLAPPLLVRDWRRFRWNDGSGRWLAAAAAWGILLVADGWFTFLPGISERLKFTNGLVAHSHLAMAGLITSLNVALLLNLGPSAHVRTAFAGPAFWLWQGATAAHIAGLLLLGWVEGAAPQLTFDGATLVHATYGLRWAAGAAMLMASGRWWIALLRRPSDS